MATRIVRGTIHKPDGTPWQSAKVKFALSPGSYTPTIQYPEKTVIVYTNVLGYLEVPLWVNQAGQISSEYTCSLPSSETFKFVLPLEDGTPISLSLLRQINLAPSNPQYAVVLERVEEMIQEAIGANSVITQIKSPAYPAATSLSALRSVAVESGQLVYATIANIAHAYSTVGIIDSAISAGEQKKVLVQGPLTDSSWDWQSGTPIFLGLSGNLTQFAPSSGFVKQIAIALAPTQIYIDLKEPILL